MFDSDHTDFTLWADAFGDTGMGLPEDISGDGEVDIGDFTIWADNFGNTLGVSGGGVGDSGGGASGGREAEAVQLP